MNRDLDYIRSLPVGVRHLGDGIAVPEATAEAKRVRRYALHVANQKLVYPYWREVVDSGTGEIQKRSEFRLSICGREAVSDEVRIYRQGLAMGYSGLQRCGNVWGCIVCATKVLRRRGEQISALFKAIHAAGGSAVMVTLTAGHDRGDALPDLLIRIKTALRRFSQSRGYRDLVAQRTGKVVATEVTWNSRNGWHPHSHQVWFFPTRSVPGEDVLASGLFPLWQKACARVGLNTLESYQGRRVGVDVRVAWDASEYLTKFDRERGWDLSAEVTAGRLKTSQKGSLTPWGILEEAVLRGRNSGAFYLWLEYLRSTKGLQTVSLRGARDLLSSFGLPTNSDDWADANQIGDGEIVGTISANSYHRVIRQGGLGRLLEAARSGGLAGLDRELQSID